MKVAFVHHGEKTRDDESAPLTQKGRAQIHRAAQFVLSSGIRPETIICTKTTRTIESAHIVASYFHDAHIQQKSALPELWEDWLSFGENRFEMTSADCIVIGHHPTLGLLKDHFHLKLSLQSYSSVIILKRDAYQVWSVTKHHQGAASL